MKNDIIPHYNNKSSGLSVLISTKYYVMVISNCLNSMGIVHGIYNTERLISGSKAFKSISYEDLPRVCIKDDINIYSIREKNNLIGFIAYKNLEEDKCINNIVKICAMILSELTDNELI